MRRVAFRDFEQQHPPALRQHLVPCPDAHGRFDGIGADFHEQGVQCGDLLPRHALRPSIVGDAAKQHAAARIGERRDLVRPVVSARAARTVPDEFDLLELPGAVLARLDLADDVLGAVTHRGSPKPGRFTFPAMAASMMSAMVSKQTLVLMTHIPSGLAARRCARQNRPCPSAGR